MPVAGGAGDISGVASHPPTGSSQLCCPDGVTVHPKPFSWPSGTERFLKRSSPVWLRTGH